MSRKFLVIISLHPLRRYPAGAADEVPIQAANLTLFERASDLSSRQQMLFQFYRCFGSAGLELLH